MVQQQLQKHSASYIDNANNPEKYSLRQRQRGRKSLVGQAAQSQHKHNIDKQTTHGSTASRSNRVEVSQQQVHKLKTKAAPLSKYRRKTANARERSRMREINLAFESLRQCVPPTIAEEDVGCTNEKLTKITTLRLAMKYISKLSEALTNPHFDVDFLFENKKKSYEDSKLLSDCSPAKQSKQHHLNSAKPQAKRSKSHSKNNEKKTLKILGAHNHLSALTAANSTKTADCVFPLSFDSDGESIQLSEMCMTENSEDFNHEYEQSQSIVNFASGPLEMEDRTSCKDQPTVRNPLEISLCILDDSFSSDNLNLDPQPMSCSSPFLTMDPFNPFNDLLHHEFSEHNSLDLFLT